VPAELFADADGFSMAPPILAFLPGGVELASLPDPRDEGATLEDDSSVFLVRAETFERIPALAELDAQNPDADEQALIIRPHFKLDPDTGYVVILRDTLRTQDGGTHTANEAFRMLRDGVRTADPAIEKQRESFVLVNEAIAETGLDPEEVVLAWAFHTRSEEQVVGTLVAMQQMAWAEDVGDYTIVSDATDGDGLNRIIEMTFEAPNFLDADGLAVLDANGAPVLQGRVTVPFRLTIPVAVDETRPVILYGHGFLGHYDQSSRGAVNQLCRERRYSAVAADLGFNEEAAPDILTILATNLAESYWVISLNWQNMTNFTSLAKLTKERLALEITADRGAGEFLPLDGENIHYSGISNGGTFGYVMAATSPALTRAVLIVGGGGLTHFLQRAVQWSDFKLLFESVYPDPLELQLVLSLLQTVVDPIDSINYVHRMTANRFPGLGPLRAQVHMAVNDSQVRNILTEWIARTAELPLMSPSAKEIWGLTPVTGPLPDGATGIDSALYVYDEHVEPSPITNEPPLEDNDTHGTANRLPVMQEHWYQFIEYGQFVHVCDGPCDPL
jgi:pimeloyl-ACP methyl ester carboxylesterase